MGSNQGKDLIEETLAIWQERYSETLSDEDARQIITATGDFFNLLARWDHDDSPRAEEIYGGGHAG